MRFRLTSAALAIALTCAAVTLLLHGWGKYYFGGAITDLTVSFYPYRVFIKRWLSLGVVPLWDPHVFSGYPVLETQQMFAMNPIRLLCTWLFAPRLSLLIEAAGYTIVASLASWIGLRQLLKCSAPAALIGTITWVFGGYYTIRVGAGHFTVLAGICWWPLATALAFHLGQLNTSFTGRSANMHALLAYAREPVVQLTVICLGIANSMVLLAGGPQYVVYLFYMELAVLLVASTPRLPALVANAASWIIALCLSAPQWIPTLWYLPFTGRSGGFSAMGGPGATERLLLALEFMLPHPLGDDLLLPHIYQKAAWETCSYAGVLGLILSLALLLRVTQHLFVSTRLRLLKQPSRAGAGECFGAARQVAPALLLGLGLYLMLGYWLPGFGSFRESIKARAIVAFGISWAAAIEFDGLVSTGLPRAPWWRSNPIYVLAAALVIAVAALLYLLVTRTDWFIGFIQRFPTPLDTNASVRYQEILRNPLIGIQTFSRAAAWVILFGFGTATGLIAMNLREKLWRAVGLCSCMLLCCADLFAAHWHAFYARHPYDKIELEADLSECMRARLDETRSTNQVPWRITMPSDIINKTHFVDGLYETGGYDPLMPAQANTRVVLDPLIMAEQIPIELLHRATGRRFDCSGAFKAIVNQTTCVTCIQVHGNAQLVDIERKVAVGVPAHLHAFGPRSDNLNYVGRGTAEWLADKMLPVPDSTRAAISAVKPVAGASDGHGIIEGEVLTVRPTRAPQQLTAEVSLASPGLLVYRTTWLPGWKVRVDGGAWSEALCANRWMVCTTVGAGAHTVDFRYRPVLLIQSVGLAAGTWVLVLAALFLLLIRRRFSRRGDYSSSEYAVL